MMYLQADELRYVYQRLGFQCLSEALFEDAGKHLFAGELDPRAFISYYPDLRGSLFDADETLDMFSGVAEHMPTEDSVDEISKYENSTQPRSSPIHLSPFSHPFLFVLSIWEIILRHLGTTCPCACSHFYSFLF